MKISGGRLIRTFDESEDTLEVDDLPGDIESGGVGSNTYQAVPNHRDEVVAVRNAAIETFGIDQIPITRTALWIQQLDKDKQPVRLRERVLALP